MYSASHEKSSANIAHSMRKPSRSSRDSAHGHGRGSSSSGRSLEKRFSQVEGPCGMKGNMDGCLQGRVLLLEHNPRRAYELTKWVHEKDPFNLHASARLPLVELGHKASSSTWRITLWLRTQSVQLRGFLSDATTMTGQFRAADTSTKPPPKSLSLPCLVRFGNAYAAQDEVIRRWQRIEQPCGCSQVATGCFCAQEQHGGQTLSGSLHSHQQSGEELTPTPSTCVIPFWLIC